VCQPRVLGPADEFDASPGRKVALHRLRKQRCARCDRLFVSSEPREVCAICSDDEEAFAAIFG
jgi:rubrerythrin